MPAASTANGVSQALDAGGGAELSLSFASAGCGGADTVRGDLGRTTALGGVFTGGALVSATGAATGSGSGSRAAPSAPALLALVLLALVLLTALGGSA